MRLTYEATADVAYLSLRALRLGELLGPTLLVEPDQTFSGAVALDFSLADGRVVGLEFQMASACLPAELLARAERADGTNVERRPTERFPRSEGKSLEATELGRAPMNACIEAGARRDAPGAPRRTTRDCSTPIRPAEASKGGSRMTRSTIRVSTALAAIALLLGACGAPGGSSPATLLVATPASGELAVTSPVDGAVSETKTITVTGTAPNGAEVVRDIPFASDDRVSATGGMWSMSVDLDEGENELTFRIGDDKSTAKTISVTYRPAAATTPAPTPEPTAEVTAEPTPEPTAEPTPGPPSEAFAPFTLKGRGNKVAKFKIPEDTAAIATITNKGTSNFAVWTVGADGSTNELLVNEIGNYKGTRLFDVSSGDHSVAFKIESNESWTITVKPVTRARRWDGAARLAGTGSDVIQLTSPTSGLTTATITHQGQSNFAVWAYSSDGRDLLVNEIGRYSGESLLPDGTLLFEIEADGAWTMTLQ